jgi:hypothetical protein
MQYPVPQFIDTEDKIAGPFTIRQFIYICVTAGVIFGLYFIFQSFIFIVFALLVGGIGVGLAFVKINGQPLSKLAVLGFFFYWNPQLYLWQPDMPALPKTAESMSRVSSGLNLESIISGTTLKKAWHYVETGSKPEPKQLKADTGPTTRYEVFRQVTGELRAAHRVDFTA